MKKTFALIILTFTCLTLVRAQEGWVDHKADNRISVKFPNEPQEVIAGTFASHDKDSLTYVFTVVDFVAVANVDSVALAPVKDTPQFAAQLKQGISSSLPDVALDDFKIDKWKGFSRYTSSGINNKDKSKLYTSMILIGNKMYSLSVIIPDGKATLGRDTFFASLALDK
jgi:hypothetical protein